MPVCVCNKTAVFDSWQGWSVFLSDFPQQEGNMAPCLVIGNKDKNKHELTIIYNHCRQNFYERVNVHVWNFASVLARGTDGVLRRVISTEQVLLFAITHQVSND
jgi:hypothetical protein